MSSTPVPPYGRAPLHVVQVLGDTGVRTGLHVRSLSAGLAARGLRVTVCAPGGAAAGADRAFVGAGAGAAHVFRRTEPETVAALRVVCADADLVHAHGLRAGLLAALALRTRRGRVPLVATWHTRFEGPGARTGMARVLERQVARSARVVLGATSDLVDRARRRGARDARLAPPACPLSGLAAGGVPPGAEDPGGPQGRRADAGRRDKVRADLGATGRPLLVSVGPLVPYQGHRTLLAAARSWCGLEPPPLLAIAGEGRCRAALQRRIGAEGLPVRLLGRRSDALELLAAADVAVLASRWEGRTPVAQEALRAGVPLVATAVGGLPELVGDAALLVPYGDAGALAGAVAGLLGDPARRGELAAAGRAQAATWPTEEDVVVQVLSVYDELVREG